MIAALLIAASGVSAQCYDFVDHQRCCPYGYFMVMTAEPHPHEVPLPDGRTVFMNFHPMCMIPAKSVEPTTK